ncbi:MAG: putative bifunctional diguanylate cyclase/phosphodiesterase [Acidimicrobiia bacterium]
MEGWGVSDTTPSRLPSRRRVLAALGAGWLIGDAIGLLGALSDYTFVVLALAALAANVVAIRAYRPRKVWPWRMIALALLAFLVGGAARESYQTLGDLSNHRSLVPDYLTFPGYVFLAIGLSAMVRQRRRQLGLDIDGILDGVIASVGTLTLAWLYLINPTLQHGQIPLYVRVSLSFYPPMSAFLVSIAVRIATVSNERTSWAQKSFVLAMSGMLFGDVVYMLVETHRVTMPTRLVDLPYAAAFLVYSFGASHPTMRELTEPIRSDQAAPTRGRIALVAGALAIPAVVTAAQLRSASTTDRNILAMLIALLTLVAVLRVFRALRAHARSEERLAHQATHDPLTALPNRRFLHEYLPRALGRAAHSGLLVGVLYVDLDRFKLINDAGGHSVGDELLKAVGRRLVEVVGTEQLVARLGGDEFLVVLQDAPSADAVMATAELVRSSFVTPFAVLDQELYTSASVGVAIAHGEENSDDIVTSADTALYRAKDAGRDAVAVFDASMRDSVAARVRLERDLRRAVEQQQFQVYLQPIVRSADGHVEGFEALVRWFHPERGQIPPIEFIPIAEETGSIVEIGRWVMQEACRSIATLRRTVSGGRSLYVAVNLSARQMRDADLVADVYAALVDNELPSSALCLEITESLLMDDPAAAAHLLQSLREAGIRLSLDDFGTGYSSLAYLKRFPVDYVKIDRSFVMGLTAEESSDKTLVAAIIAMAKALGMRTVAEGVETHEQAMSLIELGADRCQGYLYSRPVAFELVRETVERLNALAVDPELPAMFERGSPQRGAERSPLGPGEGRFESFTET